MLNTSTEYYCTSIRHALPTAMADNVSRLPARLSESEAVIHRSERKRTQAVTVCYLLLVAPQKA